MTQIIARLIIDTPEDIEPLIAIVQRAGYIAEVNDFRATAKDSLHKRITILKFDIPTTTLKEPLDII